MITFRFQVLFLIFPSIFFYISFIVFMNCKYTHVHDLPPQIGGCPPLKDGVEYRKEICKNKYISYIFVLLVRILSLYYTAVLHILLSPPFFYALHFFITVSFLIFVFHFPFLFFSSFLILTIFLFFHQMVVHGMSLWTLDQLWNR